MQCIRYTQLAEGIHTGYRHHSQSSSTLVEPLQERPNQYVWGIWRRFLKMICYDKIKLKHPLGPWFARRSSRRHWPNYHLPYLNLIQVQVNGRTKTHRQVRHRVFAHIPCETEHAENVEGFPVPVDITHITDGIRISSDKMEEYTYVTRDSPPLTFQEFVKALPEHEAVLLQNFDLLAGEVATICTLMSDLTTVILVSDGSAAADYGS